MTDDDGRDDQPPAPSRKRLVDRGLFWLALVIVVALGALAVSFLAEKEDVADAGPPRDILAFCTAAKNLSELPEPSIAVGEPSTDLRNLQLALDELAAQAPGSVAASIQRVNDALTPVIALAEQPSNGDPEALQRVTELLDSQSAAVADDDAAVSAYIERNCGFDPAAQEPVDPATTGSTPDTGSEAPGGVELPSTTPETTSTTTP